MIPRDTTPEAARIQADIHRRLGPEGRLALAFELSNLARELAEAGFRRRHPDVAEEDVKIGLAKELYGLPPDD